MGKIDTESYDFGYVIGTILGDGCLAKDKVQMGTIDKEFAEEFKIRLENCFHKKANINIKKVKNKNWKNQFVVTLCSVEIRDYLVKLLSSLNWIDIKPKNFKKGVLKGLFDSEGNVDTSSRNFRFSNSNYGILNLFKNLCNDININTSKIKGKGREKSVNIYPIKDRYSFYKQVGLTIKRKEKSFEEEIKKRRVLDVRYNHIIRLHKGGLGYKKINKIYPELSGRTILDWYKDRRTPYCHKFTNKIDSVLI